SAGYIDFAQAKSWLELCTQKHDICWRERARREKQKHLGYGFWAVDIETRRIVEAAHGEIRYVALSYVWGPHHRTYDHFSQINQEGQHRYVPFPKALPKTLADAVELCARMGERYIWIDALCIDQADEATKSHVIANMHLTYMGATFTIVAD